MSSTWGESIRLSIFGESHGTGIGVVLDGLPAGEPLDFDSILLQMARRAPGNDPTATKRREADAPEILSGVYQGKTTGAPLAACIRNTDTRSRDYENLRRVPRPGHADYTGFLRYGGHNDPRGGGHFSGRLTAPLVFAGAVCRQILARRGVIVGGHVLSIGCAQDTPFDPVAVDAALLQSLSSRPFSVIDPEAQAAMRQEVESARREADSIGGVVECAAVGLPGGLGSPMFGGVENVLSSLLFGIPAIKGLEFGEGFGAARLRGSQNNDSFIVQNGRVATQTNRHGGILGGITSGMPLLLRAAFKPTPSIGREQKTVDLTDKSPAVLSVEGRHDPCIVPRALPAVEAAAAVGLLEIMKREAAI